MKRLRAWLQALFHRHDFQPTARTVAWGVVTEQRCSCGEAFKARVEP